MHTSSELAIASQGLSQCRSAALNSQIQSVEADKTQLNPASSQLKDGKDTIQRQFDDCRADLLHYPERSLPGDRRYIRRTASGSICWRGFCKDAVRFLYGESTDQWCGRGSQCKERRYGSSLEIQLTLFPIKIP